MNLEKNFEKAITVVKVSENEYVIKHSAALKDGTPITVKIINEGDIFMLSDNQSTLKYMNARYSLKARDVKMCITKIIKLYGFSVQGGRILAKLQKESDIPNKFFDFIMCISQLVNMHIFFDTHN